MSARLITLLAGLAPRERAMLGVLTFLVLPVALWFGVLMPLADRRAAAETARAEALALQGWVAARATEMAALEQGGAAGPRPPIGMSALEQSLLSAQLRPAVSELANRAGGGIDLRFDRVVFVDLMGWLGAQDPGWGYDIVTLRLTRQPEPGMVTAEIQLMPQG